ncbi:MAG: hypothetical protein ACOWWM_01240 [Desulfobacterales bacterium]
MESIDYAAEIKKLEEKEASEELTQFEKLDVRLYVDSSGQLVDVKKLWPGGFDGPQYQLEGRDVSQVAVVMIGHNSPACTYWTVIKTPSGWKKICLG